MTAPAAAPTTAVDAGRSALDEHDVLVASRCPDVLRPFNLAGVLHPADIHTAVTLCRLTGVDEPSVLLAVALAVRGPRVGHVCVDLTTVADTVTGREEDAELIADLPWPADATAWIASVRDATALVAGAGSGSDGSERPLTLDGNRLYLDRYWRYERLVARELQERATREVSVDADTLRAGIEDLFRPDPTKPAPKGPDLQRLAAATAVTRSLAVIAGGPGTGKTTTVAKVLALLDQQQRIAGGKPLRIALVAPTGKAAARLEESLREALGRKRKDEHGVEHHVFDAEARKRLQTAEASTIHRLLRWQPGNQSRFRHHAGEPLPHDVVIVDEASMVSLSLMAKLLDALPAHGRFILVGDPQQLQSVEAGAVLGDIVGPALLGPRLSSPARVKLASVTGTGLHKLGGEVPAEPGIGDGIIVLDRVYRFEETSGIADLATAIQHGDADEVLKILSSDRSDVTWIPRDADATDETGTELEPVRERIVGVGTRVRDAARAGDAAAALEAVEELRVLCAHRRGPFGVAGWVPRIETWLGKDGIVGYAAAEWPAGRPVMMTVNDHQLRIYNGDVGVVVATDDGPRVAFPTTDEPRLIPPTRLESVETVHAMTIHKSQGSQFTHSIVVLPTETSLILSRELLYTGVTRAVKGVTIIGSEPTIRAAVDRQVRRASGLMDHLWGSQLARRRPAHN